MTWIDESKARNVLDVARQLGLRVARDAFGPCPSCGTEHRGKGDKRLRCVVLPKVNKWRCTGPGFSDSCGANGDVIDLVAYRLTGQQYTPSLSAPVKEWFTGPTAPAPIAVPTSQQPSPDPPPISEVVELWERCRPVTDDQSVADYLEGHHDGRIDPESVARWDLARALPKNAPCPRWARRDGAWSERGFRLIVRMFRADGPFKAEWASLHARNVELYRFPVEQQGAWKGANPANRSAAGLFFSSPPIVAMPPDLQPAFEVTEGVPDFLRLAMSRLQSQTPSWTIGHYSGSLTDGGAARLVPRGAFVGLRLHDDGAGRKYEADWIRELAGRADVGISRTENK